MKKWNDLSIQWKLALPLGMIALLLISLTFQQVSTMRGISADFNSIQKNYFPSLDLTLNADRDLYQAQVAERTIAMGGFDESVFASYQENVQQVTDRLKQVQGYDIEPSIKASVDEFLASFDDWHSASLALLQQVRSHRLSLEVATRRSQTDLSDQFEASREILNKIGEDLSATSATLASAVNKNSSNSINVSLAMNCFVILIALTVALVLPKMIIRSINRLQSALSEIASGKGDLTARIQSLGEDELGRVSATFNAFLASLQALVTNIMGSAGNVNHSSATLDNIVLENTRSIDELASSIQIVASSLTEMAAAVNEVSSNTQEVSNETNIADREAQNVSGIFRGAIQDIGALSDNVDQSVSAIKKLEEEALAIASVVDVIQGIAEQTNLLALNAAIEAARAGDQGRGFAVVADEVRSLASKTQESTENINNMIIQLQNGVNDVVKSMDTVKQKATSTVGTASHAEHSLNDVASNLTAISGRAIQVASAVEEQSLVVEDISKHIEMINRHADELTQRAGAIADASAELKRESGSLTDQVGSFRV